MADASASEPNIAPVYLFYGDEALLVSGAERDLIATVLPRGASAFSFASASADSPGDILGTARTQPMMVRHRVVVIRELEKAGQDLLNGILAYLEAPSPSTVLVLCGAKLPPAVKGSNLGRRVANRVKKIGVERKFAAKMQDPRAFVRDRAALGGCTVDGDAVRLLVDLVGRELSRLQTEVDKLVNYCGGEGTIGTDAVEAVCSLVAEAVIWELTDAIVARDTDRALSACHRMLDAAGSGGSSHRLLSMVAWQVRQMLSLQSALRARAPLPDSWQRVPGRKRDAAVQQLRRRTLDPARTLEALAAANRSLNRSRAGDQRVFEALVLRLTAG